MNATAEQGTPLADAAAVNKPTQEKVPRMNKVVGAQSLIGAQPVVGETPADVAARRRAQQEKNCREYLAMEDEVRNLCELASLMGLVVDRIVENQQDETRTEDGCLILDKLQEKHLRFIAWKVELAASALEKRYEAA
jgi:hypothetical protein